MQRKYLRQLRACSAPCPSGRTNVERIIFHFVLVVFLVLCMLIAVITASSPSTERIWCSRLLQRPSRAVKEGDKKRSVAGCKTDERAVVKESQNEKAATNILACICHADQEMQISVVQISHATYACLSEVVHPRSSSLFRTLSTAPSRHPASNPTASIITVSPPPRAAPTLSSPFRARVPFSQ